MRWIALFSDKISRRVVGRLPQKGSRHRPEKLSSGYSNSVLPAQLCYNDARRVCISASLSFSILYSFPPSISFPLVPHAGHVRYCKPTTKVV